MKGKQSFAGLNDRRLFQLIGQFGEKIAASLVQGDVVSGELQPYPFADVINPARGLAVQVKMCNGRHAQRPLPQQVIDLFTEIDDGFLFDKGIYVFVFYRGVHESAGREGKSKLWSRRLTENLRREIIANELQYIYIVDVRFLRSLIDDKRFMKRGGLFYNPDIKPRRDEVLYLNRSFMKGFSMMRESHRCLLDTALGHRRWSVRKTSMKFRFDAGSERRLERVVPVHVIGTRITVSSVLKCMDHPPISVSLGSG